MNPLDKPVSELNRIGDVLKKRLNRLGIKSIRDLLFFFPFRYEEFSGNLGIADLKEGENVKIKATVSSVNVRRAYRRNLTMVEVLIFDSTAAMQLTFFNQPFLKDVLKEEETFYFSGKVKRQKGALTLASPKYEKIFLEEEIEKEKEIVPVYPLTEKLTQKQLSFLTDQALQYLAHVEDWIPEFILKRRNLLPLPEAVKKIHRPKDIEEAKEAARRLEYDNFFDIQSRVCFLKSSLDNFESHEIKFEQDKIKSFVDSLPFELTNAQKKVSWKVLQDIEKNSPMNRLIQGDVGSGKTIVGFMAMYQAVISNYQTCLMAPTEILSKQHYKNALNVFKEFKIPTLLLTSSTKRVFLPDENLFEEGDKKVSEKKALELIESGEVKMVVGTHSVISDKVKFKNLALSIIDEQHRFGVKQRGALRNKLSQGNLSPHYLSMTATPIPRTQALFLFGDLDVSVISEMPKGRKRIITKAIDQKGKQEAYDFIENEIKKGRQCFVVCPLIDPSDKLGVASVEETLKHLKKNIFPKLKIEMLHGKMKANEKDLVMKSFKDKEFDILVSTSVVEVGVDVPNATIMLIEGAERFGLAQLHQFRGRVGRGEHQSYCFLASSENTEIKGRLKAMESIFDGLELAKVDLRFRGPGQVYGTAQSGVIELSIGGESTSLFENTEFIEGIREDIFEILKRYEEQGEFSEIVEKIKNSSRDIYLD